MIVPPSPSEDPLQLLPQSLRERLGSCRKLRCLSSRDFREVYLVEDSYQITIYIGKISCLVV